MVIVDWPKFDMMNDPVRPNEPAAAPRTRPPKLTVFGEIWRNGSALTLVPETVIGIVVE